MLRNRRFALVAGLGVIELWIVGLILRSISGGHGAPQPPMPPPVPPLVGTTAGSGVRSIETGSAPSVIIDDDGATLTVTARAGSAVVVSERNDRHGFFRTFGSSRTQIERTPDGVRIEGGGGDTLMIGSAERHLDVAVPPRARLDVRNAATMSIAGLRSGATLHSDDGSVMVSDHEGDLHISTSNGRIELRDVVSPVLEAGSDNGRVGFDRVRAVNVAVTTENGRIEIERSLLQGGKISTSDGRVALALDPRSNVTVSATAASGKILTESPLVATVHGEGEDATTMIRIGAGAGRLDVGSADGSISIRAEEIQRT